MSHFKLYCLYYVASYILFRFLLYSIFCQHIHFQQMHTYSTQMLAQLSPHISAFLSPSSHPRDICSRHC